MSQETIAIAAVGATLLGAVIAVWIARSSQYQEIAKASENRFEDFGRRLAAVVQQVAANSQQVADTKEQLIANTRQVAVANQQVANTDRRLDRNERRTREYIQALAARVSELSRIVATMEDRLDEARDSVRRFIDGATDMAVTRRRGIERGRTVAAQALPSDLPPNPSKGRARRSRRQSRQEEDIWPASSSDPPIGR